MPLVSHFSVCFARSDKLIPLSLSSSLDLFLLCAGSCFTPFLLNINDHNCTQFSRGGLTNGSFAGSEISPTFPLGKVNHYAGEVFVFISLVEDCSLRHCGGFVLWLPSSATEHFHQVSQVISCAWICV